MRAPVMAITDQQFPNPMLKMIRRWGHGISGPGNRKGRAAVAAFLFETGVAACLRMMLHTSLLHR
jgi:hypothetical protein